MPRYYFDIDEGDGVMLDDTGTNLPGRFEASEEATAVLPEIAKNVAGDHLQRTMSAAVRSEDGPPFFRATLRLSTEWLD